MVKWKTVRMLEIKSICSVGMQLFRHYYRNLDTITKYQTCLIKPEILMDRKGVLERTQFFRPNLGTVILRWHKSGGQGPRRKLTKILKPEIYVTISEKQNCFGALFSLQGCQSQDKYCRVAGEH